MLHHCPGLCEQVAAEVGIWLVRPLEIEPLNPAHCIVQRLDWARPWLHAILQLDLCAFLQYLRPQPALRALVESVRDGNICYR